MRHRSDPVTAVNSRPQQIVCDLVSDRADQMGVARIYNEAKKVEVFEK